MKNKNQGTVVLLLFALQVIIYFCITAVGDYRDDKLRKKFFNMEFDFIIKVKTIDSSYKGRMNRYLMLYNSKSNVLFKLIGTTFDRDIYTLWDSAKIGDSIYKKKNTWYLILDKKNNPQNKTDTFWYGPRYFKKLK